MEMDDIRKGMKFEMKMKTQLRSGLNFKIHDSRNLPLAPNRIGTNSYEPHDILWTDTDKYMPYKIANRKLQLRRPAFATFTLVMTQQQWSNYNA